MRRPGDHSRGKPLPPNYHQDTLGLLMTLGLGPEQSGHDGVWSEAQLRRGWAVYRNKVMRRPANSTRPDRPWAWWVFDLGEEMPDHYPRRLARLLELGELSEGEVVHARQRALEGT